MLERVQRKGNPLTLLVGMQTNTATMENSAEIPQKTGNRTVTWPSNPTAVHTHQRNQNWNRHVYPNVLRSTAQCSSSPITARTWKQPRCPSADEWIRKLWYIYTMEYYSAIKKNAFESVLMRWMKLEPIIQSDREGNGTPLQYSCLENPMGGGAW